jgi:hypothetical protein
MSVNIQPKQNTCSPKNEPVTVARGVGARGMWPKLSRTVQFVQQVKILQGLHQTGQQIVQTFATVGTT